MLRNSAMKEIPKSHTKLMKLHKLVALVMGAFVVLVIIRHLWQEEGLGSLVSQLTNSLK